MYSRRMRPASRSGGGMRIIVGLVMAAIAIFSFLGSAEYNPVTGENQHVALTENQEIALGLRSVPEMYAQFGAPVQSEQAQEYIDELGFGLVQNSVAGETDWEFEFTILDNPQMINAFALPGGPVFITTALVNELETDGQVAAVLAHEIGHVLARHGARRIAKDQLTQGLVGAVVVATDPNSAQAAAIISQLVNLSYGREDELESDRLGVRILAEAGWDPRAMIRVQEVLASQGGARPPELFSTHPNPGNRIAEIEAAIREYFPNGVPDGLRQ